MPDLSDSFPAHLHEIDPSLTWSSHVCQTPGLGQLRQKAACQFRPSVSSALPLSTALHYSAGMSTFSFEDPDHHCPTGYQVSSPVG